MSLTKATQNVIEGIVSTGSTGISAGSFIVGQQYKITSLGTTTQAQWNTIAGTTGQTYVVGSLFTAATTGASSGTGAAAVARTLATRFADVVNVKDFGAVGDGVTDDTAAIQAAVTFVAIIGKQIFFPAGTYKILSVISTTGHLNILGEGEKTILDFSGITSGSSGITVTGSIAQIQNVTNASKGGLTITFASAPSLTTGDVFCLFDNAVLWNSARAYYYSGEWLECRGTSGLNATTTNPLYDSYSPATVKAYKLSSPEVSFKNFRIVGGANIFGLIQVSFCDKPIFENISAYNENYQCIIIDRCYRAMVTNCVMYNKGTGTLDDYGLTIGNSQKVQVTGGDYYARRHGIAIGGGDYPCAVTNRNVRISNLTISNDIQSGVYSADMHGNMEDCVYQGCMIYQGAGWAGKDNGYDNCTIYNALNGWCIYSSEVKGGELFVRNSKIFTNDEPSAIGRGIIDVGGNSSAITTSTTDTVNIIIENNYIFADNAVSGTDFVKVVNSGSTQNINIYIDGVRADVNDIGAVLRTRVDSGSSLSQAIVVDNISNFPTGIQLHIAQGGSYLNTPQRLMRQSGYVSLAATSGTSSTTAAAQTYRYAYPRFPQCAVTTGQETSLLYNGNLPVIATAQRVTTTEITPAITSGSATNWTSTATVNCNWSVGIEEV